MCRRRHIPGNLVHRDATHLLSRDGKSDESRSLCCGQVAIPAVRTPQMEAGSATAAEDEAVTGADPDTDTAAESADADGQGSVSGTPERESDIGDEAAGEES